MQAVIDLGTELLVDRSLITSPQLRFLLTALGEQLARNSPWVAVDKFTAIANQLPLKMLSQRSPLTQVA